MLPCELAAGFTLKLTQQREKGNEMFLGSARCKIVTAGVVIRLSKVERKKNF